MKTQYFSALAGIFFTSYAVAEPINFNSDWQFIQKDVPGAEVPSFKDTSWRKLDVPHDWSIEGEYSKSNPMGDQCGYLPAGFGWYRKTISVPSDWKNKHVEIAFDGVFMNSTVWANGKKLGTRPYGWSSFRYEISDIVDHAESITFAVRVDNDQQPSARWYTGSGIYTDTWIDVNEKIHIPANGVFIRTDGEKVSIVSELANKSSADTDIEIRTHIEDSNGKNVAMVDTALDLPAGSSSTADQSLIVETPKLWSLESPNLYTAVNEVYSDGKLMDRIETRFGFRTVEWKPESGMWLNGKNVKLQGVCNHQDAGALGAAVPEKILRFRIAQLKAMGCNAIRTSHNPQTPDFYNICDELGMLVMDEIFDGWRQKAEKDYGGRFFAKWWNRDLTDWIKRDRNHPSVIIYSIGNETHGDIAEELVARCHELDPTRPVTSGDSNPDDMDVYGVNGSSEKKGFFDTLKKDRVFIGTENTHTWQVRGFYRTKTWYRDGFPNKKQLPYVTPDLTEEEVFSHDWTNDAGRSNAKQIFNSSYDNGMVRLNARRNIQQLRDIPNYAGSFRWTGYDYIGEAGYVHGGWPFKSFMGGAIDMANFEKDLYYLYQSQWTKTPMVHILPHWTHPTLQLGTEIPVWVYSNCDSVELFLNDRSLGKQTPGKTPDDMQCQWMVGWQPGTLKAVGYKAGKVVSQKIIHSAEAPSKIALSIDGDPLAAEGKDIVQVRVAATDSKDEFYPYGENRTHFSVIGPAKIRALDNGSPIDVEKHFEATDRNAFYGLTRAYVESSGDVGDIAILASSILGEKRQVSSDLVSIDTKWLALRGEPDFQETRIFYTVNGSEPSTESTPYDLPFPVSPETTVRALVTIDGKPAQYLEERFGKMEGFTWVSEPFSSIPPGNQAETATFENAKVSTEGKDFHGKGFLDFKFKSGAYVEWYQENDGDAGPTDLKIRYSGKVKNSDGNTVQLMVNGQVIDEKLLLPNTKSLGQDWWYVTVQVPINKGANTIRITTVDKVRLLIDEMSIE